MTNQQLKTKKFVTNYNLKSTIEEFSRNQNDTQSKLNFRSFNIHRGRSCNHEWKDYPKLQIIISLLGPSDVGKSCLAVNIEYGQPQLNHKSKATIGIDIHFFYLRISHISVKRINF